MKKDAKQDVNNGSGRKIPSDGSPIRLHFVRNQVGLYNRADSPEKIEQADAIVFGSPIYLGAVTGEMRSFLERLIFQYLVYDKNYSTLFSKKIQTGFIYTMNVDDSRLHEMGYERHLNLIEMALKKTFCAVESLFVTDTYQFDDYAKYVVTSFNPEKKAKRRKEEFPNDCKKAFKMGAKFATGVITEVIN